MPMLALVCNVELLFYLTNIIGYLVLLFHCAYEWLQSGL